MTPNTLNGIIFSDFLDILLRTDQCASAPQYISDKLAKLDPTEQTIHIENGNVIWRINEWRTTYAKWKRDKELSAHVRTREYAAVDAINALAKHLSRMTRMDIKNCVPIAQAAISSRNEELIRKLTGMNLGELLKADKALAEYKKENKIK